VQPEFLNRRNTVGAAAMLGIWNSASASKIRPASTCRVARDMNSERQRGNRPVPETMPPGRDEGQK